MSKMDVSLFPNFVRIQGFMLNLKAMLEKSHPISVIFLN